MQDRTDFALRCRCPSRYIYATYDWRFLQRQFATSGCPAVCKQRPGEPIPSKDCEPYANAPDSTHKPKSIKRVLKKIPNLRPFPCHPQIPNAHVTRPYNSPSGGLRALRPRLLAEWQLCSPSLPQKPNSATTAREEAINERHAQ